MSIYIKTEKTSLAAMHAVISPFFSFVMLIVMFQIYQASIHGCGMLALLYRGQF